MSLKRNIASLQLLQLSSFGIPLIVQPWLARSLGPAEYGRYNFVIAVISYFVLLTDFGFNWSATRALAVHNDNEVERSKIVCTTYVAKVLLAALGFALMLVVVTALNWLRSDSYLLLIAYVGVLGSVLAPVWYFQGMEIPHVTSFVDITMRLLMIPVILLAVQSPDDLLLAVTANAVTQLLIGIVGLHFLLKSRRIVWTPPTWKEVLARIRAGFPLFLSTSAVNLYTTSNSVILGVIAGSEQLAYFSAAQKLSSAACSVFVPINQALYPRISGHFSTQFETGLRLVKRALLAEVTLGFLLSMTIFILANPLCILLFGQAYAPAAQVLRYLALLPILLAFIGVFANLVMLPLGQDFRHLRMVTGAAAINLISVVPFVRMGGAVGAAASICLAELFVASYSAYQARRTILQKTKSPAENAGHHLK